MVIALNILAFVFLLFLVTSPNKGITSFQFMLPSIVIVLDNIVEATYNPAYLSTAWFQILFGCNILLWLFIVVRSDSQESVSYKIDNKFKMNMLIPNINTISELRFAVIRVANKRIALTKI